MEMTAIIILRLHINHLIATSYYLVAMHYFFKSMSPGGLRIYQSQPEVTLGAKLWDHHTRGLLKATLLWAIPTTLLFFWPCRCMSIGPAPSSSKDQAVWEECGCWLKIISSSDSGSSSTARRTAAKYPPKIHWLRAWGLFVFKVKW